MNLFSYILGLLTLPALLTLLVLILCIINKAKNPVKGLVFGLRYLGPYPKCHNPECGKRRLFWQMRTWPHYEGSDPKRPETWPCMCRPCYRQWVKDKVLKDPRLHGIIFQDD